MNTLPTILNNPGLIRAALALALELTVLSLVGFLALRLLQRAAAPVRGLVCGGVLTSLVGVVALTAVFMAAGLGWAPSFLPPLRLLPAAPEAGWVVANSAPVAPALPMEEARVAAPADAAVEPVAESPRRPSEPESRKTAAVPAVSRADWKPVLATIVAALAWVWLVGALIMLGRLAYGLVFLRGFSSGLRPVEDARFHATMEEARKAFGLAAAPLLFTSPAVASPISIGLGRPRLILPESLLPSITEEELRGVIFHETAHILHGDHLMGLIQRVAVACNWWNPLVYRLSASFSAAREEVGDTYAIAAVREAARYARCLLSLAEKTCLVNTLPATAGMAGGNFDLQRRIQTIIQKERTMITRNSRATNMGVACALALLTLMLAVINGGCHTLKQERKTDVSADTPKEKPVGDEPLIPAKIADFIADSAKYGFFGQKTGSEITVTAPPFIAVLSNGVRIELVGFCDLQVADNKWWRPDGSEIAAPFSVKETAIVEGDNEKPYAMLVNITGTNDINVVFSEDIRGTMGTGSLEVSDAQGRTTNGLKGWKVLIDPRITETSLALGMASGSWTEIIDHDGLNMGSRGMGGHAVCFSEAQQANDGVQLVVTDDYGIGFDHCIVAMDGRGVTHEGKLSWGGAGKVRQSTAKFTGLKLADIKSFRFQARPYTWVRFENISLRPKQKMTTIAGGHGGNANVIVGRSQAQPQALLQPGAPGARLGEPATAPAASPAATPANEAAMTAADRKRLGEEIAALKAKIYEKAGPLLGVTPEDRKQYEAFLQQTNTGLIRLLPRGKYENLIPVNGAGAYYSFAKFAYDTSADINLEYAWGPRQNELHLKHGDFAVGFNGWVSSGGIIMELDAVSMDAVTLAHPDVQALAGLSFKRGDKKRLGLGEVAIDGKKFNCRVRAKPGATYLLRSLHYRFGGGEDQKADSDILVAFNVIRQDPDGSMLLLWKRLSGEGGSPSVQTPNKSAPAGGVAPRDVSSADRERIAAEILALKAKLNEKTPALLTVAPEDRKPYETFLSRPKTGMFWLLPRGKYENLLPIREGGAFYSFTRLAHEYDGDSDIYLEKHFIACFTGLITTLDDVALDAVSPAHTAARALAGLSSKKVDTKPWREDGVMLDGQKCGRFTTAKAGVTYLLRSIKYSGNRDEDEEVVSDILVAFRAVRQDTDGSMLILWKQLNGGADASDRGLHDAAAPTGGAPKNVAATARNRIVAELDTVKTQLNEIATVLLEVTPEDRKQYETFLQQPKTGLIRLLPRGKYENLIPIQGGGAYYSFSRLTHEYGYGSDIELAYEGRPEEIDLHLKQGQFSTGFAGMDIGLVVKLDDALLETVSPEHPVARALAGLSSRGVDTKQWRYDGVTIDGKKYTCRVRAKPGATYLLRSLAYDAGTDESEAADSDLLVAFHVVRQDADGSMLLLWKLLERPPATGGIKGGDAAGAVTSSVIVKLDKATSTRQNTALSNKLASIIIPKVEFGRNRDRVALTRRRIDLSVCRDDL